jgi:hypothetical protein
MTFVHRRNAVPPSGATTLPAGFIPPCLPMNAARPPSGSLWLHEIYGRNTTAAADMRFDDSEWNARCAATTGKRLV